MKKLHFLRQLPVNCKNLVADLNSFMQLHEKGPTTVPLVSKCKKQMGVSKKGREQLVKFCLYFEFKIKEMYHVGKCVLHWVLLKGTRGVL